MTCATAAQVLRLYNDYRRSDHEPCDPPFTAREVGEAIDKAIEVLDDGTVLPDVSGIIRAVCRETDVTEEQVMGNVRLRRYAEARAMVAWLCRRHMRLTMPRIGKAMNRTHATVVYYLREVEEWLRYPRLNPECVEILKKLDKELDNGQ